MRIATTSTASPSSRRNRRRNRRLSRAIRPRGASRSRKSRRAATSSTTTSSPTSRLKGGDTITGADWALTAIHTPGHAPDHLCLALAGRHVVFSGDHVMAWNTTVVAPPEGRMADYVSSLEILSIARTTCFCPDTAAGCSIRSAPSKPTCCTGAGAKNPCSMRCYRRHDYSSNCPRDLPGPRAADDPGGDAFRSSPRRIPDREGSGSPPICL